MSAIYDQSSLVFLPSGYKDGKLYSQKPLSTSGELSFSRGSDIEATRVNANGYIDKAQVNLLLQSNQFDTTWSTSNVSVTSGQSGYDGSTNAWLLSKSAANGFLFQTHTFVGVQSMSIYAKAGTSNWLNINIGGSTYGGYFDLLNGVTGNDVGSPIATKITDVGGGWYRCEASGTYSAATSFRIYVADSNGSTSGTSGNIYIQDAQLNYGLVAQTYQETTTAAVVSGITNDMPRLNYDPANPTCPSLLLEPSRQNLLAHSEFIGDSSWVKTGSSVTSNATASPEGVVNASFLIEDSSTGVHQIYNVANFTSGTTYTFSIFAKNNGRDLRINLPTSVFGSATYADFNLSTGVVITQSNCTASIEEYANGFYRCIITDPATATSNVAWSVQLFNGTSNAYAGDGTSGAYLYGAQLESGSYVSSMVPTYGSSATRTADACSKTGISSLIGQTEGTVFLELEGNSTSVNVPFRASDGTNNNRVQFEWSGASSANFIVSSGGVNVALITGLSCAQGTRHKVAMAYKANDFVIYIDGALAGSDTSGAVPTSLTQIEFAEGASYPFSGTIDQALLFTSRLSNADLATLTTL